MNSRALACKGDQQVRRALCSRACVCESVRLASPRFGVVCDEINSTCHVSDTISLMNTAWLPLSKFQ